MRVSAAALLAVSLSLSSNLIAEDENGEPEIISMQFSQTIPGGGTVTGLVVGQDLDGDGRLYSMAPGLAGFIGAPEGDEVIYASVRIEGVLGDPVTVVYDREVAGIDDPANFFFGFSVGIGNDYIGQDPEDGLSFAPLAPSTSYIAGALMGPAWADGLVIEESIGPCGDPDTDACSAIITLDPVDPFPNFELMHYTTSDQPIVATDLLRYEFEQGGFDNGARIYGTITGRDLDGDGRIYSASPFMADFLGIPMGDEVMLATVTIVGMEPLPIRNVFDLVATPIEEFDNFFFGASVAVDGDRISEDGLTGFSISPWSPSTSYVSGELFSGFINPVPVDFQDIGNCNNDEDLPCGALVTLVPDAEEEIGARLTATAFSSETITKRAAPFVVDANFSGHWDNTVPGGEGLILQVIANGYVLGYWVTYDAAGNQRWMYGFGRRQGASVIFDDLFVTSGGVMATTSPQEFDQESIGEMSIDFSDCNNANVEYTVDNESGTMEIYRLTGLGLLECVR
ncbi:MAG: hypothetical protein EA370_06760 [Wenzhouxiangella sp.]|nr:MAG: hypothetical protein EA370_06760 [Wenzhouxiangella sp.]